MQQSLIGLFILFFILQMDLSAQSGGPETSKWIPVLSIKGWSWGESHKANSAKGFSFGVEREMKLIPTKGFTYHTNGRFFIILPKNLKIGDIKGELMKQQKSLMANSKVSARGKLPVFVIEYQDGNDLIFRRVGEGDRS